MLRSAVRHDALDFAAWGPEAAYEGWRVAAAGDVNGDGSGDVIAAAHDEADWDAGASPSTRPP
jgi:hypothetical protein